MKRVLVSKIRKKISDRPLELINLTQIKSERQSKIRLLLETFFLKHGEGILRKDKQESVFPKGVTR
jgi:hypothetical protein